MSSILDINTYDNVRQRFSHKKKTTIPMILKYVS